MPFATRVPCIDSKENMFLIHLVALKMKRVGKVQEDIIVHRISAGIPGRAQKQVANVADAGVAALRA